MSIVVFGASGGIGRALVERLVANSSDVVAVGRSMEKLRAAALGEAVQLVEADATDSASVASVFKSLVENGKAITGVANCIGSLLLKPAHLTTDDEWAATFRVNVDSAFYILREAARHMTKSGGGSVVLCSSVAARIGLPNHEAIAASKAALIGLALSASATYAAQGVRVNCVAPGLVETPMTARITGNEAALKASVAMHPLGRIGQPEDVARVMAFLLSDDAQWITGQVYGVDGGLATLKGRAGA